jgi:uncharacterized protein YbcI
MTDEVPPGKLPDGVHTSDTRNPGAAGELNAAIARSVAQIYRAVRGRGPTKARAWFRGDVVVVILEGVCTPMERSLAARGRSEELSKLRRDLHAAMEGRLNDAVAALTGSGVRVVLGDSSDDPDVAVEVFVLDQTVYAF